ncbi:hypothetical protein ACFQ9R_34160 [Nocardia sp. NPDC056541]|uniref:hypothetical protein n=1 Tax=Nocardia sp. NPDC056541 TaxID=3345860 RepID=UPI0036714510
MAPRLAVLAIPAALGLLFLSPVIVPAILVGDDHDEIPAPVSLVTEGTSGCSMFCDDPEKLPACTFSCDDPDDVPVCSFFCDTPETVSVCTIFCGDPDEVN